MVRVRAGQATAGQGAARDRHARLLRVLRLRADARAHSPHGAEGQHRHLPTLADRRGGPLSRPVRHRALHDLGREGHPRCRCIPAGELQAGAAPARQGELLRLLLRRRHHGEPREPVQVAAPADAEGDLPRRPTRWRLHRLRRAGGGRLPVGHPVDGQARVPLRSRRRHLGAEQGQRQLQRDLPEAAADPEEEQGPRAHARRQARESRALVKARRVHGEEGRGRCVRLELLLEGLGRVARLRL